MPAGKGKVMLRCSIRAELYEALLQESQQRKVDLGSLLEGYVVHARQQGQVTDSVIMRRLETVLHGQEQILRVLEAVVATMEGHQGSAGAVVEGEHDPPPIASYAQMYGTTEASPTPPVMPEAPPAKRSWRPW